MSEVMTFEKAKEYIDMTAGRGSKMGLEREYGLMRMLGQPQDKVKIIHIAGTNGKGSFGAMLTAVLCEAGYRVGGFSSPALTGITDSFRINGEEITKERFGRLIGGIMPLCEGMADKPTQFEVLTAAAFRLFEEEGCDIALVECGMGGDTDSTNVISSPVLSVITNIQLDHCGSLGNTPDEIAAHKAGIIKRGRPVYFGGYEGLGVIADKAERCGSRLYLPDRKAFETAEEKCGINCTVIRHGSREYEISLGGTYQQDNAVNVLSCIGILRDEGLDIPESGVKEGLKKVHWHGRNEVLCRDPLVVYDGSHNPDGIRCAAETIRRYLGGRVILLIGVMADKDYELYPEVLGGLIECVCAVKPCNPRALDADRLAEVFVRKGVEAYGFDRSGEGVAAAVKKARESGLPLLALGMLYMYEEFCSELRKAADGR